MVFLLVFCCYKCEICSSTELNSNVWVLFGAFFVKNVDNLRAVGYQGGEELNCSQTLPAMGIANRDHTALHTNACDEHSLVNRGIQASVSLAFC